MRPSILAWSSLCLLACGTSTSSSPPGSPGSGSGSVSGTLLGKTFTPKDAASVTNGGTVTVVLADASGICSDLMSTAVTANSSALVMMLPAAVSGMKYSGVNVQFAEFDATCNSPSGESGSGTVTITSANAGSISGTFAFSLNSDSITGSFVAPTCAPGSSDAAQTCR
jgi:hypothetical protein